MASADVVCLKKIANYGAAAMGQNSRVQAKVKRKVDKDLKKLEARKKLREKLLDRKNNKEEPKPITEDEKIKTIMKEAWTQTGCSEVTKKASPQKKDTMMDKEDSEFKKETLKPKFTAFDEKVMVNYCLDLAQNSKSVSFRTIRFEMYKCGKIKDVCNIFKKASENEESKNWLYSFLNNKLKPDKKVVEM